MQFQLKNFRLNPLILSIQFLLLIACSLNGQSVCSEIDFESIPNDTAEEGLEIEAQFLDTLGVAFELEDGTLPTLSEVGAPSTAFGSAWGNDEPAPNENVGSFFLTDDGVLSGLEFSPVIITFETPLDSVSGAVLDMDFDEQFIIQAFDNSDSMLVEIVLTAGDPGTGDGVATPWGFKRNDFDVDRIRISGIREVNGAFGLAFDNLVFCASDESSSTQSLNLSQVNIFPNPASNAFSIRSSEPIKSINLFDLQGEKVSFESSINNRNAEIICEYKGVLVVELNHSKNSTFRKIILN